jgi:hypothetical protein
MWLRPAGGHSHGCSCHLARIAGATRLLHWHILCLWLVFARAGLVTAPLARFACKPPEVGASIAMSPTPPFAPIAKRQTSVAEHVAQRIGMSPRNGSRRLCPGSSPRPRNGSSTRGKASSSALGATQPLQGKAKGGGHTPLRPMGSSAPMIPAAPIPAMPKPRASVAATVSDQVRRAFMASSSGRVVASAAEQLTWPR